MNLRELVDILLETNGIFSDVCSRLSREEDPKLIVHYISLRDQLLEDMDEVKDLIKKGSSK